MNTTIVTATELKNNAADILNRVYYEKKIAIVERYGEPIARIVPVEKEKSKKDIEAVLKKYYGIMPEFPDVTKMRIFRKRKPLFT